MRQRLVVHPYSTGAASLADDLALSLALGLRLASVATGKLAGAGGVDAAAAQIRAAGMDVAVVHPSVALDLADPSTWPVAQDALARAADVAVHLACDRFVLAGGTAPGLLWEQATDAFEAALGPALAACAHRGVRPLLEPVRPQFAFAGFVHAVRDGVLLARRVGRGLGLAVDVTHCWWEPGLARLLADNVDLVGTVHLADLRTDRPATSRVVPGDGHLPIGPFLAALDVAGYTGPLELELIGEAIDAEGTASAFARAVAHVEQLAERIGASGTG